MLKIVSTYLFIHERLHPGILDRLQEAGVEGVELFCDRRSFDYTDRTQVELLANWFRNNPMKLHSLHSPMHGGDSGIRTSDAPLNIADPQAKPRLEAMDEILRALEVAESVPCTFLVQHLGVANEETSDRKFDAAFTSVERLRLLARQLGVTLLLENIPNGLSTPEVLLSFLHATHLDDVGLCFDSGHAQMGNVWFGGGGAVSTWDRLHSRVRSTHLHDNHGARDEHLWPGQGSIDWPALMARIARQPDVAWVLEAEAVAGAPMPEILRAIRETFQAFHQWSGLPAS